LSRLAALGAILLRTPQIWYKTAEAVHIWQQIRPATKLTRMLSIDDLFNGRRFDQAIIVLCVRWHLRFRLSFRDLVAMMAERGISLAYTAITRWI
jgi:hypothetical protein